MKIFIFCLVVCNSIILNAYETYFYNNYKLGQRAGVVPGGEFINPITVNSNSVEDLNPIHLFGNKATNRLVNFIHTNEIPKNNFTIEFWILNHVNTEIGVAFYLRNFRNKNSIPLTFAYYGNNILIGIQSKNNNIEFNLNLDSLAKASFKGEKARDLAYKNWNYHFVMTISNQKLKLFQNSNLIFSTDNIELPDISQETQTEIAAYLKNEPFMDLSNILRYFSIDSIAQNESEIINRNTKFKRIIDKGLLHPEKFHFNAGPYLQYATKNSINIIWETDRNADFMIEYGKELPLNKAIKIENLKNDISVNKEHFIQEIILSDLESATQYFYNIKARSSDGEIIESGVLTFATAVEDNMPYSYVVIGDTEARAHINDQLSKLIWAERPNFMIIAGDLTDGGLQSNKYEWNYEYFQGMNQIVSRIPVFPILGNGEGDVYWYDKYHFLPGTGENYSFKYGNSEHFLLNSNRKNDFAEGGIYYNWLDSALSVSKAKWKFVTFHHAPYSSDEDDYGNTWEGKSDQGDLRIRKITPLFDKYDVDMVFYGHLHCYERSFPIMNNKIDSEGTRYILTGGAGGNLEDFAPTKTWFNQKTYRGHHYVKIDINADYLEYYMYDINGNMIDSFNMHKSTK